MDGKDEKIQGKVVQEKERKKRKWRQGKEGVKRQGNMYKYCRNMEGAVELGQGRNSGVRTKKEQWS